MQRYILHCDCNSFFASVELLFNPHLENQPVAVCGNPEKRHGIILAKNDLAKAYNIQTAETVYSALKKCPNLQLLAPHYDQYDKYSKKINAIYSRFTDLVEPFGIDESWLDITGSWHLFGSSAEMVANEIRRTVKNETGITISVGVSFNKIFAKLGSDYKKPDAVTVFSQSNYRRLVWPLPVGDLLYVGKSTQKVLKQLGIINIGQLAAADTPLLQQHLGKLGIDIQRFARGEDNAPVAQYGKREEVKTIGNGMTFSRNLIGYDDVKAGVYNLADEVASRLRGHNLYATSVQVVIKDTDLKSISRQKPLSTPTNLAKDLSENALQLIKSNWNLSVPIRMITITAQHLTNDALSTQISLFETDEPQNKKRENLERSLDAIRHKYGKNSIAAGRVIKNDLGLDDISIKQEEKEEIND